MFFSATFPGFAIPPQSFIVSWVKYNSIEDILDILSEVRKWAERDSITDDTSICKMTSSLLRRKQAKRCLEAGMEPVFPAAS